MLARCAAFALALAFLPGCGRLTPPRPLSRAEKLAKEEAELLLPFKQPHVFEPAADGYKVVFPGKPHPPQFRDIMQDGATWIYEEQRLGRVHFIAERNARREFYEDSTARRHLDWSLLHFRKHWEKQVRAIPEETIVTERYFQFAGRYEAAEATARYKIADDYDYQMGLRLCRTWYIVTDHDIYSLNVDGAERLVASPLADDFFNSFELRPKLVGR